ncbi:hypothetical protein AK812_SmicGene44400 [Symbiodinium microadriaticum]|uniref:Uncharacterized protein n=1 Tax=Symbiodinium microadriaticum TaxID=2951 RepID=A0A1Q9BYL4_SYMMI|nr:hypothetical protein AK812_SmicGene44400 [Symbiodinium microadriaticum]
MGGTSSVVLVPCARNGELPNGWREELQAHCRNNPQDHCALPPDGDDPDAASEAFRGWIVSVVKNAQTSTFGPKYIPWALPPDGDDPDAASEAFRGWIVSVVKNAQTSSALSEGTASRRYIFIDSFVTSSDIQVVVPG